MLREWQNHAEFRDQLRQGVIFWSVAAPERLRFYAPVLSRVELLNLDPAREVLAPAYPTIGRPCERQAQLLRALFVMTFLGEHSLTRFVQQLHAEPILALACGFQTGHIPGIASFYAFQHRVWPGYQGPRKKRRLVRPGQRLGSGEKLKERRPGVTQRLVNQALVGRRLNRRPERLGRAGTARQAGSARSGPGRRPARNRGLTRGTQDLYVRVPSLQLSPSLQRPRGQLGAGQLPSTLVLRSYPVSRDRRTEPP